jgi:Skp family chaperone for outer membrane proteins
LDNNFRPEAFRENMRRVYKESQQRNAARESLELERQAHLKRVQEEQATAAALVRGNLEKYRGDSLALKLR